MTIVDAWAVYGCYTGFLKEEKEYLFLYQTKVDADWAVQYLPKDRYQHFEVKGVKAEIDEWGAIRPLTDLPPVP